MTARWDALLQRMAESIDIPPSKYKEAVDRYRAVGTWLDDPKSAVRPYRPLIFPQGSFALGTVVRPVREGKEADYDIDLVCELAGVSDTSEPAKIKTLVGNRLKEHETYRRMLDPEGRRCWTLVYSESDGIGFHLDALPSVPAGNEVVAVLVRAGVEAELAETAISITEKNKRTNAYIWIRGGSNPRGFARWFAGRTVVPSSPGVLAQKRSIFVRHPKVFARIEDVPDGLLRSPLQRAIQILKRHRDVRFAKHELEAEKPISMILTTVAARAYRAEPTIEGAISAIVGRLEGYVESGVIRKENGLWVISNPVNPGENFADRWNDRESRRAEAFFEWVQWVRQDLSLLEEAATESRAEELLRDALGLGSSAAARSGTSLVPVAAAVPGLGDAGHCEQPPWPVIPSTHRVRVQGKIRHSRDAKTGGWELTSRPVPKGKWIRFEATTNVSAPHEVKWQVVNTGAEAAAAGQRELRGDFYDGSERFGAVRWESTAYRGTHWVEAFVVKNGTCVARSGRVLVRVAG